jgi:hypothetical protein
MSTLAPPAGVTSTATPEPQERLRPLPAAARRALPRFHGSGDPAALDLVIFAVLEDCRPQPPGAPLATLPGTTRLIEVLVHSLDDDRNFVRHKVHVSGASG